MGADGEAFPDPEATPTAILARVGRRDRHDRDTVKAPIVADPREEQAPTSIMNTLGEVVILHHVLDVQVFVGNQVVRRDQRTCLFHGEVFTLPTHFLVASSEALAGFATVLAAL